MAKLEPPDVHFFRAAVGWMELGNLAEAKAELAQVSAAHQEHPDVLELRWSLAAHEANWEEGLRAAQALLRRAPDNCNGWLHQAYALRRAPGGGLQQAWDALLPAASKFPKESVVHYNLACYACQMGNLEEARHRLKVAARCGGKTKVKAMALADADLEPLWKEIKGL